MIARLTQRVPTGPELMISPARPCPKKEEKMKRRIGTLLLGLVVLIFSLFGSGVQASAAGSVTVSVEKFSIGQGYLMEPAVIALEEGETAAELIVRVLEDQGIDTEYDGTPINGFYLSAVEDSGADAIIAPLYAVLRIARDYDLLDPRNKAGYLGEFDYTFMSGWMYSVNHVFFNVGASDYAPQDGDVIRWQFTLYGYGADLGSTLMSKPYLVTADKDALTAKVAEANGRTDAATVKGSKAYKNALTALKDLESGQEKVDAVLTELTAYLNTGTDAASLDTMTMVTVSLSPGANLAAYQGAISVAGVTLDKIVLLLEEGDASALTAAVTPFDASDKAMTWASDHEDVAAVDNAGTVTAVSPGEAVITVTTNDGNRTASCHVTVTEVATIVPVIGIALNKTELSLITGDTEILNAVLAPENASDQKVTWTSNHADIAKVDAEGKVTAVSPGEAVITVTSHDGDYATSCTVMVQAKPIEGMEDVVQGVWYYDSIDWAMRKGTMLGVSSTRFGVNDTMTRAMFVTVLYRYAGEPSAAGSNPFLDVPWDTWYTDAVIWANKEGIAKGIGGNRFAPDTPITREEIVTMLDRYLRENAITLPDAEEAADFADEAKISAWAKEAVAAMQKAGIVMGKENHNFAPQDNTTRAEAATVFWRLDLATER